MRRICAVLLVLLPFSASAQPAIPNTPAGKVLAAWLESFNSGDRSQFQAFSDTYHYNRPVDAMLETYRLTGGFSLLRVETSEPLSVSALVAAKESDAVARRTFTVSAGDLPQITTSLLEPAMRPAEFAIARLTQPEALKALSERADYFVAKDQFSGALLVARNGKVIFDDSWGLASRETRTPITPNTKFRLGSINKMFTSVAVLQLVQQSKLALDATVGTYLPDYPNRDVATKVTVRQLLSHTGGTGDIFGLDFDANRTALKTHSDYLNLFGARAPEFEPGTKDAYSNYGFVLLGLLVEKASGMPYYDYVREHIFRPAGMQNTDSEPETVQVQDRSLGYTGQGDEWVSNASTLPWRGTAAGGGYSTVGDLLNFANALETGKLLPRAVVIEATTSKNHEGWYGFGFSVDGDGPLKNYGHNGGTQGMNAEFRIYPNLGTVIIGLSNFDPPIATTLVDFYAFRMPATQ